MAKAENLTGKTFGFLTARSRAQNIIYGGQPKAAWMCECKCGNKKVVAAYDLKRGSVTSFGCRQTEEGKKEGTKKDANQIAGDTVIQIWTERCKTCHAGEEIWVLHIQGMESITNS